MLCRLLAASNQTSAELGMVVAIVFILAIIWFFGGD